MAATSMPDITLWLYQNFPFIDWHTVLPALGIFVFVFIAFLGSLADDE
jgi:hypothetical protein